MSLINNRLPLVTLEEQIDYLFPDLYLGKEEQKEEELEEEKNKLC